MHRNPKPDPDVCRRAVTASTPNRTFQAQDARVVEQARDLARAVAEDPKIKQEVLTPPRDRNLRMAQEQARRAGAGGFVARHPNLKTYQPPGRLPAVATVRARDLDHHRLNRKQHVNMAYASQPLYNRRCDFDGGSHCSRLNANHTGPACTNYSEHLDTAPDRRLCDYRRCTSASQHHTCACPMLHSRCPQCGCRGHMGGCRPNYAPAMEALRGDFEEVADVGIFTHDRVADLGWGFYPYPRGVRRDRDRPIASYSRLTSMPVLRALQFMADLVLLPENRVEEETATEVAPTEEEEEHEDE